MRAYRSCASARCGCRSSPVSATRCAASNWPFRRNSSPSRRNTRLSGSWASWEERVLISSAMKPRTGAAEGLGRRFRAAHVVELRQLGLRARGEPLPLIPLLHGFGEAPGGDERVAQAAVGRHEQRVEPQCAPQLVHPGGGAPGRELEPPEQQVHGGIMRVHAGRLLGERARRLELPALQRVLGPRHELGQVGREGAPLALQDRKSTRLNSSHLVISYAVFCLKKKKIISSDNYPRHRNLPSTSESI